MAFVYETAHKKAPANIGAVTVWSYLKPLRRKVGVVMLVLACAFVAGWARSLFVADTFAAPYSNYRVETLEGSVLFEALHEDAGRLLGYPEWESHFLPFGPYSFFSHQQWHWRFLGFGSIKMVFRDSDPRDIAIVAPFWSIVLSLTLLSAWLLLSKPRAVKPKPASEPRS